MSKLLLFLSSYQIVTASNAVVELSEVVALGTSMEPHVRGDADNEEEEEMEEEEDDDDDDDGTTWRDISKKESVHKKHVQFRDDQLVMEFDDKNLWKKSMHL